MSEEPPFNMAGVDYACGAMEYRETITERVFRFLGFRHPRAKRPDELGMSEEWYQILNIYAVITLGDRLRILLTGRMDMELSLVTGKDAIDPKAFTVVDIDNGCPPE